MVKMEIPYMILFGLIAMSVAVVILGVYMGRKDNNSVYTGLALFIMSGIWMSLFLSIDTITMGYSENEIRVVDLQELYHLHHWNTDINLFSGANTITAIRVSGESALLSTDFFDRLDCIQFPIKKTGAPTGLAEVGIFNTVGSLQPIKFGEIDVATLLTTYTWKEFCLEASFHHFIQDGDFIGIRYTGGGAANFISIGVDTTNPIDSNIFMSRFSLGTWTDVTATDLSAVLYNRAERQEIEVQPINFEFTLELKVFFLLVAAMSALLGAVTVNPNRGKGFKPFDRVD